MMEGTFHSLSFLDVYQKLPNFFVGENQVNLTPCQAHQDLQNMFLGGAEDEHFPCFNCSCQLGLRSTKYHTDVW